MSKTPFEGFENTELQLSNEDNRPEIDDRISQSLVRLMGFDAANKIFRLIKVNPLGQLLLASDSGLDTDQTYKTVVLVYNTPTIVLGANPNRLYYAIRSGAGTVSIGSGTVTPYLRTHLLPAISEYSDYDYKGDVSVTNNSTVNQTIEVIEVFANG